MRQPLIFGLIMFLITFFFACKDSSESTEDILKGDTTTGELPTPNSISETSKSRRRLQREIDLAIEAQETKRIDFETSLMQFSSEVSYDSDYRPHLKVKMKNNIKEKVVAFQFTYSGDGGSDCKEFTIRKKMVIDTGKIITFEQPIAKQTQGCGTVKASSFTLDNVVTAKGEIILGGVNWFFESARRAKKKQ